MCVGNWGFVFGFVFQRRRLHQGSCVRDLAGVMSPKEQSDETKSYVDIDKLSAHGSATPIIISAENR